MKKALKAKWLKALRGGRYQQAEGKLKSRDGGYCCLGVLCNVMGAKWKKLADDELHPFLEGKRANNDDEFLLKSKFLREFGISKALQGRLVDMNDGNKWKNIPKESFPAIADFIEKNVRGA